MSNSKRLQASKISPAKQNRVKGGADGVVLSNSGLSEDSFKNLKDKIDAQLKDTDKKTRNGAKHPKVRNGTNQVLIKGKKRTADGEIVTVKKQPQQNPQRSTEINTEPDAIDSDVELRQALKELGGTEEDLYLIAGANSESELEGFEGEPNTRPNTKKKGSTLQEGIANILKEIALVQGDSTDTKNNQDEEVEEDEAEENATRSKSDKHVLQAPLPASTEKLPKKRVGDNRFKCQPRADWFNEVSATVDGNVKPAYTPSQQMIEQLHEHAKSLLNIENEAFRNTQQSSSSQAFYNTVIASGTLSDKISALTLAVQESPLHNVKALETLISLASKRSRGQAIDVLRALKDLLAQGSLLPSDRRLLTFSNQPALISTFGQVRSWSKGDELPRGATETDLICWAYEDWLKQQYFEILKTLEVWCNDEIEFAKGRAISYVFELLKEKPEQESNLLRLLINKLGDPVKKIASQASYLLMQLLSTHPAMKMVVISAIEADFIFRPGQSMHGKYYAAVTLNQTALSSTEEDVAKKLLDIYFGLFATLLKPVPDDQKSTEVKSQSRAQRQRKRKNGFSENPQSEELREKLISAVLTGVNRAYPYVGTDERNFMDHLETLFKITHSANFNTSIQAMLLIQQLTATHSASSDHFYRTLYESLLDPRLITASKQQLYLNLLHRSLKADMNTKRVKAFVKRLLQILSLHEPSFTCGVFFLLKDLENTYPSLTALVEQAEDHEDDEEVFRDVDEDAAMQDVKDGGSEPQKAWYNGYKRAPEHANADNSCAWEVLPFLAHFHPSVGVSADHYIQHSKIPGTPDLTLHTLIHFLDRFVYRNPKLAANKLRGSSIMQPMASDDTHAVLISSEIRQSLPAVNTDDFRNKRNSDIAADDVFFHKYFNTLGKDLKIKKQKEVDVEEDDSVGDADEDVVWKAMMDSAPDLEGALSEDDDLDMSDFEDEMDKDDEASNSDQIGLDVDEEDDVDIEAGIFDDSSEEQSEVEVTDHIGQVDDESDFEGLDSETEDTAAKKKQKEKKKAEKDKRKKMKALPTFASAADYAKMLEDDEDEDLG